MPIALEGPRRDSLMPDVDFPTPVDNQAPSEMTGNSILICEGSPLNSLSGHERQQNGEHCHHKVLAAGLYVPHDSGEESSERTMVASMEPRVACDLKPADKDTDKDLDSIVGQSSIRGYDEGFLCPHPSVKSSCFVACSPGKNIDTLALHTTLFPSVTLRMTTKEVKFRFVGPSKTVLVVQTEQGSP